MAPARTGILSDAFILQHCIKYQAVPMAAATKVLGKTVDGRPPPRPVTFNTLARNVTQMNPAIRMDKMVDTYRDELHAVAKEMKISYKAIVGDGDGSDGTSSTVSNDVQFQPHPPGFPRPASSFDRRDTLYRESLQLAEEVARLEDDVRMEERTATPGTTFPLVGSPLNLGPFNAFGFPERYRAHNLPPGYTRERLLMEEMGITLTPREEGSSSKD